MKVKKSVFAILLVLFVFAIASLSYIVFQAPTFREGPVGFLKDGDIDSIINQAQAKGEYRCCMNPPCELCVLKANPGNNYKAGTCACDDLISQGKAPCLECQKDNDVSACKLNQNISSCK